MIGFVLMIARSFLPFFSLFQSFTFWFKWGFLPLPFISFVWSVNGAFFPSPWFYCCAYHLSCFVFFSTPGTLYLSLPPPFMPFIDKIPAFLVFFCFFFCRFVHKKRCVDWETLTTKNVKWLRHLHGAWVLCDDCALCSSCWLLQCVFSPVFFTWIRETGNLFL